MTTTKTTVTKFPQNENIDDTVAVEMPVVIEVPHCAKYTLLCTPSNLYQLTVGFLFFKDVIADFDDILRVDEKKLDGAVHMMVHLVPSKKVKKENQLVTSSSGSVTKDLVDNLFANIKPCSVQNSHNIKPDQMIAELLQKQEIFRKTGCTHAAALFDENNELIAFAEDIGRHNALDKVIGQAMINKVTLAKCKVALSSRLSLEMVSKAAKAGISTVVAVSAPTSLAIAAAKKWNINLCGFVRGGCWNRYLWHCG